MSAVRGFTAQIEAAGARGLAAAARRPWLGVLALAALVLATCLPGVLLLPPVDRTEIVFAGASRDMLETGAVLGERLQGEALRGKPIGAFWLQMLAAAAAGPEARGSIIPYRLPSLAGVLLAVLATYWLLAPLLGGRGAFVAAGLLAVTPILAVEATLAVADGPALAAATAAQLALLRLYCAADGRPAGEPGGPLWAALLFWTAQGVGISINALAVPLLSLSTLLALVWLDRRAGWLAGLRPLPLAPLALLLGAPWLVARAVADGGIPFQGLPWSELLAALGGSQADKWKAAPASFTLAFILGFLPGALLLWPALAHLWRERSQPLPRFLLAWIAGYLGYLELVSGKPALYSVPPLFPAAAAAVALVLTAGGQPSGDGLSLPRRTPAPPPLLPALFILPVFGLLLWLADAPPTLPLAAGAGLAAVLLALAAHAARSGLAAAWLVCSIGGFSLFLAFTFGGFLPHLDTAWPAPRLASAIAPLRACLGGPVGILGFREPSARFVLGPDLEYVTPGEAAGWAAAGRRGIVLVEERWQADVARALRERGGPPFLRLGCVPAFNVMRGCPLRFSIHAAGPDVSAEARCRVAREWACPSPLSSQVAERRAAETRCR